MTSPQKKKLIVSFVIPFRCIPCFERVEGAPVFVAGLWRNVKSWTWKRPLSSVNVCHRWRSGVFLFCNLVLCFAKKLGELGEADLEMRTMTAFFFRNHPWEMIWVDFFLLELCIDALKRPQTAMWLDTSRSKKSLPGEDRAASRGSILRGMMRVAINPTNFAAFEAGHFFVAKVASDLESSLQIWSEMDLHSGKLT